ncbi:hypothetical protein HK097_000576 [Rhizophlyctis rosea]|uniref:Uncharacterized protein n=1 Tax=Rhizophlyctis rosea TaxID=64517 RepID=A0AAD5SKN7_9FUNG|nr:hypothetical protein HK097_000576 [Rhizophlyctis rosea]
MSLKAEIFALNGLHGESITEYIKYLTLRNRDYSAWLKISAVLSDLSSAEKSHPTRSTSLRQWAKLGFEFALDIYNRTPRSDNAIAQRNKDLEYKRIQEALSGLGDCEGQPDDECLRDYLGLSQDHVGFLRTRLSSEVVDEVDTAEKAVRDL